MSSWKRDAASGLVVLVPLLVIAIVLNWAYGRLSDLPFVSEITVETTPIPPGYAQFVPLVRIVVAAVVFALLVLSVGYLMRTTAGRLVEGVIDGFFNRLPGLRVLYNASKLAVETALTGTGELQRPVRVEPIDGLRLTGFNTGKRTDDGREVVFVPTAPNITTGFVVEIDPERITETDERVEEALTRILSAGFAEEDTGIDIPVDTADGSASASDGGAPSETGTTRRAAGSADGEGGDGGRSTAGADGGADDRR
jgi:uncharacterized membrane protein